jgi:Ca2+-binding EF-hand superfamily protein
VEQSGVYNNMKMRIKKIGFAVFLGAIFAASQTVASGAAGLLQAVDTDHDGTVDLAEAKTAAAGVFDRLERDHDGTLDARELKGRISAGQLAAADPDNDGTLTKEEYLAVVEKLFKAANRDGDDTLDAKEFGSKAGRALQQLVK